MIALLIETFQQVWDTFRNNRMRFALTLLGVVIGSSSLVLLSGLLEGGKEALVVASQQAAEDDLVRVWGREPPEKERKKTARPLEQADAEALDGSPLVGDARVATQRRIFTTVYRRDKKKQVSIVGARTDSLSLFRLEMERGRFLGETDVSERRKVAVIGQQVWQDLFPELADKPGLPPDVEIKTESDRFVVIGVMKKHPSFGNEGPWQWDGRVILPSTTYDLAIGAADPKAIHRVNVIFVRLSGVEYLKKRIDDVRKVMKSTLLRRHYGVKNFEMEGEDEEDAKAELILNVISMLILGTAAMSLLVGGINVMNIMLVSVTERTREIGIRRAIGAPRRNILMQFLFEAAMTSGLGGAVGVAAGLGLTWTASAILSRTMGGWTFHVVSWAPPLAFGAALLVGAVFGLYPAWRASRLDPVEALRFE